MQHQSIDLDLVIFYTDAVKSLGVFLPFGVGMSGLDKLFDTCEKTMKTPSTVLPLQQVAAISLMSSIAQVGKVSIVVDVFLKTPKNAIIIKQDNDFDQGGFFTLFLL